MFGSRIFVRKEGKMEKKFIEIKLPDLKLQEGSVKYFDTHKKDFIKINNKEPVIVPYEVYNEIDRKVVTRIVRHILMVEKEIVPVIEEVVEEVVEEVIEEEIFEQVVNTALFDELISISGIGSKTASGICEKCGNDVEVLKAMLVDNTIELREDYVEKIKEYFNLG